MKILFLTPQLPYPPVSGGLIKTLKMIKFLSTIHEIDLGFFLKDTSEITGLNLEAFKNEVNATSFYKYLNVERTGTNFLRSLFCKVPMSVYRNRDKEFLSQIEAKMNNYDIIFIDHFLMFQYVPKEWKKKVVLHQHNAEFIMWQRYAETQPNLIKKTLINFEAIRIKEYEKSILERSNVVLASTNDIELLSKITDKKIKFMETLHLGDESLLESPPLVFQKTQQAILYIGTLTWEANRDGLYWFLQNVWPRVKKNHPALIFNVIGKNNAPELFNEWGNDPQIKWHGFVEDLNVFYDNARISVAPLNFGSGIKVKVINALYRGLPMVTTEIGVEGLDLKNGQHIFISNDGEEQARQIETLLQDEIQWSKISSQSRAIALSLYSWEGVLQKINQAIQDD